MKYFSIECGTDLVKSADVMVISGVGESSQGYCQCITTNGTPESIRESAHKLIDDFFAAFAEKGEK